MDSRNRFDLAECLDATFSIQNEVVHLTEGLSQSQFHAPTRTGGWSIGYCLEHLILTGHALIANWDHALQSGGARLGGVANSFPYGWSQRAVLRLMESPAWFRRRTVPSLEPYSRQSIEETLARFAVMQHGLTERLAASERVDLKQTKIAVPHIPLMRHSLGFAYDLWLAHERRHLRQAWAVRAQIGATTRGPTTPYDT